MLAIKRLALIGTTTRCHHVKQDSGHATPKVLHSNSTLCDVLPLHSFLFDIVCKMSATSMSFALSALKELATLCIDEVSTLYSPVSASSNISLHHRLYFTTIFV